MRPPIMKLIGSLLVIGLTATPAISQDISDPGPSRKSQGGDPLTTAKSSKLMLSDTIERAEKQLGGRAVEATFTPHTHSSGLHEIVVLKPDGALTRTQIDGRSEAVVSVTNQMITSMVTRLTPEAVGKGKGLLVIVREIEQETPEHRVIGAAVEQDDGAVSYEVTVATPSGDQTRHLDANGAPLPD